MPATRREVLQLGGALALGLSGCGSRGAANEPPPAPSTGAAPPAPVAPPPAASSARGAPSARDEDILDAVFARLHGEEPRTKQGLSTHAPMVAEAMCMLGFADRAHAWVDSYAAPVIELPRPRQRIDPARWRDALGPHRGAPTWEAELAHWADWTRLFSDELRAPRWPDILDRWVARLAPGASAAATHGIIRTAHAARALGRRDNAVRRAELARGLAYWAAAYEELPAPAVRAPDSRAADSRVADSRASDSRVADSRAPDSRAPDSRASDSRAPDIAAAIAKVPRYTERIGGAPSGNIVNGLRELRRLEGFAAVRDLIAPPDDVGAALSELTAAFARVYLAHGTRAHAIAFVHAITGPAALRRLALHVTPATARAAFPYAWQAAAGIYAAYAQRGTPDLGARGGTRLDADELAGRAVEGGGDHAIKLTEVALAEHALRADAVYLEAAADAIARL